LAQDEITNMVTKAKKNMLSFIFIIFIITIWDLGLTWQSHEKLYYTADHFMAPFQIQYTVPTPARVQQQFEQ
jgi:hypothetical protein